MAGCVTLAARAAFLLLPGGVAAQAAATSSAGAPANPRTALPVGMMPTAAQAQRSGARSDGSPSVSAAI